MCCRTSKIRCAGFSRILPRTLSSCNCRSSRSSRLFPTSTSPHSLSSSSCLLTSLWGVVLRTSFVSLLPLQNRCYRTVTQLKDDENLHQGTSKFMDPVCIPFLFVKCSSVQVFLDSSTLAFSFALVVIIRSFLPTSAL